MPYRTIFVPEKLQVLFSVAQLVHASVCAAALSALLGISPPTRWLLTQASASSLRSDRSVPAPGSTRCRSSSTAPCLAARERSSRRFPTARRSCTCHQTPSSWTTRSRCSVSRVRPLHR